MGRTWGSIGTPTPAPTPAARTTVAAQAVMPAQAVLGMPSPLASVVSSGGNLKSGRGQQIGGRLRGGPHLNRPEDNHRPCCNSSAFGVR